MPGIVVPRVGYDLNVVTIEAYQRDLRDKITLRISTNFRKLFETQKFRMIVRFTF